MLAINTLLLFFSLSVLLIFVTVTFYMVIKPLRLKKQAWAFYSVRDELLGLVRDGHLTTDSVVFDHFYNQINFLIRDLHPLSLTQLVKGVENVTAATIERMDTLLKSVQEAPPEVREVVGKLFFTTGVALVDNSNLLQWIICVPQMIPSPVIKFIRGRVNPESHSSVTKLYNEQNRLKTTFAT